MIAHHKMLWPDGTDSWAFNYPGEARRAANARGRRAGRRALGAFYGRFGGLKRIVWRNPPYRQVTEIAGLTEGYG